MTLNQLRALASYWLDDINQTYFTPTQLGVFLNNAQIEVGKSLRAAGEGWYSRCVETTLVVNQREYVLPDDFAQLERLEYVIEGSGVNRVVRRLTPITPNQQDQLSPGDGVPVCYFIKKNRLVLFPAPQTANTIRMLYQYKPAVLVNGDDVPDVPDEFQEMIAVLAARDGLLKDGRDPSVLDGKIQYYNKLMDSAKAQRKVDESRFVQVTGDYDDAGGVLW